MADYRLTAAAQNDFESIWRYTVERWGAEQAELYADHLTNILEKFARSPKTASRCDAIRPGYRRGRAGLHMIYFRETDYGIAVIRILHHRMDAGRQLLATQQMRSNAPDLHG